MYSYQELLHHPQPHTAPSCPAWRTLPRVVTSWSSSSCCPSFRALTETVIFQGYGVNNRSRDTRWGSMITSSKLCFSQPCLPPSGVCVCVCVNSVLVKRLALPLCAVDGRYRNPSRESMRRVGCHPCQHTIDTAFLPICETNETFYDGDNYSSTLVYMVPEALLTVMLHALFLFL